MWNFNDASSGNICGSVANFCMTSSAPLTRSRTCTILASLWQAINPSFPEVFLCTGKCTRKHKKNLDLMVTVKLHVSTNLLNQTTNLCIDPESCNIWYRTIKYYYDDILDNRCVCIYIHIILHTTHCTFVMFISWYRIMSIVTPEDAESVELFTILLVGCLPFSYLFMGCNISLNGSDS